MTHTDTVRAGNGVAMMPEDLHSIHIHGSEPIINFHMYVPVSNNSTRGSISTPRTGSGKCFPPHDDIREAR